MGRSSGGGVPVPSGALVPLLLLLLTAVLVPHHAQRGEAAAQTSPSPLMSPSSSPEPSPADPGPARSSSSSPPSSSSVSSVVPGVSVLGDANVPDEQRGPARDPPPASVPGVAEGPGDPGVSRGGGAAKAAPLKPLRVGYLSNVGGKDNIRRQGLVVSGAMTYAILQVNNDSSLLPGYHLEMLFNDTRGEMLHGTKAVIESWRDGAVAFFGPEDSCYVEASVAASLNLPMISYKCSDASVTRIENSTFARTVPSEALVVRSVSALLRYYNWRKFSIVHEDSANFATIAQSLERQVIAEKGFTLNSKSVFQGSLRCCELKKPCCRTSIADILEQTYAKTRVYVYMGNYLDVQTLLILMRMKGLTEKGEYLVIMIDHDMQSWEDFNVQFFGKGDSKDINALTDACRQLMVILPRAPGGDSYSLFTDKVREFNEKEPFNFPQGLSTFKKHITVFASYLYDSVMLYADAVTKLIHKNHSITDGRAVIREIIGRKRYSSVTGADMSITESGDVEGNYTVLAFLPVAGEDAQRVRERLYAARGGAQSFPFLLQPVGGFKYVEGHLAEFELNANRTVLWKSGQPPLQEPPCGYDGSGCNAPSDNRRQIVASILGVLLVVVSVCTTVVYRNWKYEQEIAGLLWMIDRRDLEPLSHFSGPKHSMSKMSIISQMTTDSRILNLSLDTYRYRGTMTYVKKLMYSRRSADIPRILKKEMKSMRELHHENVNPFVGACVEPNCIYIVTELCMKGNLQDILENDVIKLDNMFIASFVFDLIKGLRYLHESDLKVHGNLKSSNVLVTSLWVLRLTNFGLLELRTSNASTKSNKDDYQLYRGQLWRSPEVLRNPSAFPRGSQKDDVYAFAIILHEIIGRQGPWGPTDKEPQMIVEAVKKGPMGKELFRPPVETLQCQDYVLHVMHDCWAEKPDSRPELSQVQERLKKMRQGMKPNIMDNMIAMMEKYANNLEELVEERTCLLEEEKKKTEALLHRMLPKSVASQLMRGELVVPESFDFVTIYFSDIVGFTEMSASSTPLQVVTFLNDLYTCFDSIIRHYDVYKVETIGDAYMVVSGLPIRNGDAHAQEIASMALEILDAVKHFEIRHRPGTTLKLRIGIHTGPVVAGVVGQTMPRYCLFGDTVNTASRMESNGEALKIHISSQCRDLLTKIGGYEIIDRGLVKMKGKGELRTYWLTDHTLGPQHRRAPTQPLPQPLFSVADTACANNNNTSAAPQQQQHRSPKPEASSALPRRGSLIPKLPDCDTDALLVGAGLMNGSVMGNIQALHRRKQESPVIRHKHPPSRESSFSQRSYHRPDLADASSSRANSIVDLDVGISLQLPPSSSLLPPRRSEAIRKGCSSDFGCSNPDIAAGRGARNWADRNKNGLKSLDESVRPLLTRDATDSTNCNGGAAEGRLGVLAEDATKRWRSCDEIASSRPAARDRLKKVFGGLLRAGATEERPASRNWEPSGYEAAPTSERRRPGQHSKLICEEGVDPGESVV